MNISDIPFILEMQKEQFHRLIYKKAKFNINDQNIKSIFRNENESVKNKFNSLVNFFWEAHIHYLHSYSTMAYYPGYSSIYGAKNDAIEGVTRLLPLWSSYITSPIKEQKYYNEIKNHIKTVLINGTNSAAQGYWGNIEDKSTLICEAADVALSLWITRDVLWDEFLGSEKQFILSWLKQAVGKKTADNNWHLFVVLIDLVIASLDSSHSFQSQYRYERIKQFYIGNGCFKDGENGAVDYYNAWAFHYIFYWIKQIKPDFDRNYLDNILSEYVSWYKYLFTEKGYPLYGRSLCYRMAAPAPIISAVELDTHTISSGEALQILLSCWDFFISQGALRNGAISQGVFEDELLWLDPYSGPASAFWSIRSLVLYYYLSTSVNWETSTPMELPFKKQALKIKIDAAHFTLETMPDNDFTVITFDNNNVTNNKTGLKIMSLKDKIKEKIYGHAYRHSNNLQKMGINEFNSRLGLYKDLLNTKKFFNKL